MDARQEAEFERKAEKMLKGHRLPPPGRDYRCFHERERSDTTEDFRQRFDNTFPDAPGSPQWMEKKFGKKKGRKGLKTGYHQGGGFFK